MGAGRAGEGCWSPGGLQNRGLIIERKEAGHRVWSVTLALSDSKNISCVLHRRQRRNESLLLPSARARRGRTPACAVLPSHRRRITQNFCEVFFFFFSPSTLVLLRVLDILLLRKLKVRMTLYFSDSVLAGMLYLSSSSSSILREGKNKQ